VAPLCAGAGAAVVAADAGSAGVLDGVAADLALGWKVMWTMPSPLLSPVIWLVLVL
jgi:hypothetical protein